MAFFRQTRTLCEKTLTIVFTRHLLGTLIRAFFAPIIFIFFISYAKNFFVPPSNFGIGAPTAIRSLSDAVALSAGGRDTVVFIDNGHKGGNIEQVINQLSEPIRAQGKTVQINESSSVLLTTCKSSVRGVSTCFAAVDFHSSPNEGPGGVWNYTLRADGSLGGKIYVDSTTNDAEIYVLPLQHAIDRIIAGFNSTSAFPDTVEQYPYTSKNNKERDDNITRLYMGTLINILGVAYFIGIVGICYQLTGEMAKERELGMSQLMEAMMPNRRRWTPQAARLLATHISFDILYLPSWIIMGLIVASLNYTHSNKGITVGYFIIGGLALSSWSVAFASLFSRAQLSGITVVIVSIVLAIIVQVIPPLSTGAAYILTLLFPPMQFTYFIIYMAYWQKHNLPAQLSQAAPEAPWRMPGYVFFLFAAIQIVVFPVIGAMIERALFGTASKARKLRYDGEEGSDAVRMQGITKLYPPARVHRWFATVFRRPQRPMVRAVDDVDMVVGRGQIMVLLGANGSGKSTSLDMLAGLQIPTAGTIEMDAHGGIGLCPQKNVLWDELTVYEHVKIFNRLKSESRLDSKEEIKQLVEDCDLSQKLNARSETLSGGQKRKAQLAMMLTGGSKICMLDEVSSGLDPLSRRKIWDIVLAQRGKRSIILTTHFLDEADLLSDDITVLSLGKRVAHGSAVHLKTALGGGYRVHIYHENSRPIPAELESVPRNVMHDQTVYNLDDSEAASRFIFGLEKAGVRDYQVNGPSIEDVFLKLAAEVKDELKEEFEEADSRRPDSSEHEQHEKGLKLAKGKRLSFASQTWVLFRKRVMILRRNPYPYVAALLIPILTAALVTLFVKTLAPLSCAAADLVSQSSSTTLATFAQQRVDIPVGPPGSSNLVGQVYGNISNLLRPVSTEDDFNRYIQQRYHNVTPGGYFHADTPVFAWRGDYDVEYAVATQNLLDLNLTGQPISTSFQPFDIPSLPSAGQSLQFILYFGLAMCVYPAFFALYTNAERLRKVRALHYSNGIQAGPLWAAYVLFDFIIVLLVSAFAVIAFTAATSIFYGPGYLFVVFVLFGLSATLMAYTWSLFTSSQLAAFAFSAGGQCCMFLLYFVAYLCIITYLPAADIDRDVNIATFTMGIVFPGANLLRALFITFNEFSVLCRGNDIASYPGEWSVYGSCITYLVLQSIVLFAILVAADSGWKPSVFPRRKKHRTQDVEETEDVDDEVQLETARVESSQDELRVLHATKAFGSNVAVSDISFGVSKGEVFALLGPNGAGKSTTIGMIRGDTRPTGREGDVLIQGTSILRHRAAARTHLGVCPQFDAMDSLTAAEHLRFYARARGVPDVDHNVEQVLHAVGLAPFKHRMAAKLSGGNKRKLSLGIALIGDPTVVLLDEPSSGMDAASKRVMWRTLSAISPGRSLVLTTHSMEEADALAHRAGIMAKKMLALGTSDQLRKKHGDAYHVHLVHKDAPHTSEADMNMIRAFITETFPGAVTEDRSFHGQLRFAVPNDRTAYRQNSEKDESTNSTPEIPRIDQTPGPTELTSGEETTAVMTATNSSQSRQRNSSTDTHGSSSISALFSALETHKSELGLEYYSVSQATLDQVFLSIVTKHNILEENYIREMEHDPRRKKGYWWRRFESLVAQVSMF